MRMGTTGIKRYVPRTTTTNVEIETCCFVVVKVEKEKNAVSVSAALRHKERCINGFRSIAIDDRRDRSLIGCDQIIQNGSRGLTLSGFEIIYPVSSCETTNCLWASCPPRDRYPLTGRWILSIYCTRIGPAVSR